MSGYIYDQNLEPTPGGAVAIYDENNEFYGHAWTDENGYWQTWDLPTGTYYLRTQFSGGFISDVWDGGEGAQCPNGLCNGFDWSPVHLGSGDFLTNIDFVLDPIESGGSISGNVQNEGGEPLAMVRVILMNRNGDYMREVETDPQGNYDFGLQLDETYYVRTGMGPGGLAAELFDDVKCLPEFQCDDRDHVVANGFAVDVVGADVPGIDFVLNPAPGRRITGRISDAFTGIPLAASISCCSYRSSKKLPVSRVICSHGESMASTIRRTPSAVRPRPQWFSRPRTTPHSSALGSTSSMEPITHPKASSSV